MTAFLPGAIAPPAGVVFGLERMQPGIWSSFVARAERALAKLDESFVVSSWWRDQTQRSQHQLGMALDIDRGGVGPMLGADVEEVVSAFLGSGFVVVREGSHVHVQMFARGHLDVLGAYTLVPESIVA